MQDDEKSIKKSFLFALEKLLLKVVKKRLDIDHSNQA